MAGARIQLKRATASQWTSANTVLFAGEIGYETDTNKFKIGDGTIAWASLSYFNGNLSGSNLNDLLDVTITSAANGDFLRWNGSAWINDAVNLSTDTVGSYVESLVAGTGVTVTNNSGEGAAPTIAIGQSVATNTTPTFAGLTLNGNITFEGTTADEFETIIAVTDPTSDRVIVFPDLTGTVVTSGDTGTVTSLMIADGTIVNADINASAAIALSKLASGTSAQVVVADASGVPTYATLTGDVTISNTGVTSIAANSVALGTDTTGNYVNDVTAGTGVTVTHTPGEGSSPTVAIGQSVATSASPTFANVTISSVPTDVNHAATKAYVDFHAAGIVWHDAAKLGTAAVLPGTPTYDNGTSGVGATLTATSNARLIIDGSNATTNDRVLVKDQADATQNGVYKVTAQGSVSAPYVLTRATDFDASPSFEHIGASGDAVFVSGGSTSANQGFITLSTGTGTDGTYVIGTDNITFGQFTGTATFTAGAGLATTGNVVNVQTANAARIVVNSDDIDLATVTRTNTSGSAGKSFIQSFTTDSYGRVTGAVTADTAITLGTDTSGSYVESLTAGTGITLSNNSGEGASPTVAVTANTYDAYGASSTVAGNLTTHANLTEAHGATGAVVGTTNTQTLTNKTLTSPKINEDVVLTSTATELNILDGATLSTIELNYVDGVTSAIQTQLDAKAPLASPTFTGSVTLPDNTVALGTKTTGDYVATITGGTGVSSTAATTGEGTTHTLSIGQAIATTDSPTFAGLTVNGASVVFEGATANDFETTLAVTDPTADRTITLPDETGTVQLRVTNVTDTEIGYLDGVTSAIQTQINDKAPIASPTFTGTVTVPTPISNTDASTKAYVDTTASTTATNAATALTNHEADTTNIHGIADTSILVTTTGTQTLTNKTITSPSGLVKGDVGLGNVDNTADTAKPVSTAQQTALDLKAPIASPTFTGTVTLAADPGSALQAATKQYVDNVVSGVNFHQSVVAATTGNLAGTYNNGTSGVGATITKASNGSIGTIDGATVIVGSRILLKSQTDPKENGIYTVTAVGSVSAPWVVTRATDADNNPSGELANGDFCFVTGGSTNGGYGYINSSTASPIVIGTDDVTYAVFNAAQIVTGGAGLAFTGNVLDIGTASVNRIVVNANDIDLASGIATIGTYQSVTVDTYGRVTAGTNPTTLSGYGITDAAPINNASFTGTFSAPSGTITSAMLAGDIALSKLATSTAGNIIVYNSSGVPTAVTETGDVTISDTGVTAIATGVIVNADVSATAAIDLGKLADISTNAQTASYTLVLADKNKLVEMSVASGNTLTVPPNTDVAFPVGAQIRVLQTNTGQCIITAGAGVTINGTPGLKLRTQWASATLIKRATDTWVAVGDLSA